MFSCILKPPTLFIQTATGLAILDVISLQRQTNIIKKQVRVTLRGHGCIRVERGQWVMNTSIDDLYPE